jgi:alpha-methylacyl-CoA racemase
VKVVEIAGIGPGPFCGMVLADLGADVVRIDRAQTVTGNRTANASKDLLARGRRSVGVDLKHPDGVETVLTMVEQADVLIEGFRPGVTERLGIGPDVCLARNPRIIYGRMTGWGQEGPYAQASGHDINYIALAGALHPIGNAGRKPVPPLNLVGDFGGGGLLLAFGICAALYERAQSGQGQVIDAAMVDGAALLMSFIHGLRAMGMWVDERGTNLLDTGAHFYDTYETADGKYVAIGSIEPQFYAELLERSGLAQSQEDLPFQMDRTQWPALKEKVAALFLTKTRDEWCELMEATDVCFAPVLDMGEAPHHPHIRHRETFVEVEGVWNPAPAPRFARTPGAIRRPPSVPGQHTDEVLADYGFADDQIAKLKDTGAVK